MLFFPQIFSEKCLSNLFPCFTTYKQKRRLSKQGVFQELENISKNEGFYQRESSQNNKPRKQQLFCNFKK